MGKRIIGIHPDAISREKKCVSALFQHRGQGPLPMRQPPPWTWNAHIGHAACRWDSTVTMAPDPAVETRWALIRRRRYIPSACSDQKCGSWMRAPRRRRKGQDRHKLVSFWHKQNDCLLLVRQLARDLQGMCGYRNPTNDNFVITSLRLLRVGFFLLSCLPGLGA